MSWRDKLDPQGGVPPGIAAFPTQNAQSPGPDDLSASDGIYRPWILQRGRSNPPLLLELRRLDARAGIFCRWQVSYPHLVAVEYTGDHLLSLDFGSRQFVVEGNGLQELAQHLQMGSVIAMQEYAPSVWPAKPAGPTILRIKMLTSAPQFDA